MTTRKPYPSDVSDEEWAFVAQYLALVQEEAPQRRHSLREVFNGLRWLARAGAQWRMLPNDLPPWWTVYQQTQRWLKAGVFDQTVTDLRALLRLAAGRGGGPTAIAIDSRTLQSTPESGRRAGYDGHKRRKGSKVHMAVDTLGQLLALHVPPANEQDREQVAELAAKVQDLTDGAVEVAFVDQASTGAAAAEAAAAHGIRLEVVQRPDGTRGFILLPRRWVVERTLSWLSRCRAILVRWDKHAENYLGLLKLACTLLWYRRLARLQVLR